MPGEVVREILRRGVRLRVQGRAFAYFDTMPMHLAFCHRYACNSYFFRHFWCFLWSCRTKSSVLRTFSVGFPARCGHKEDVCWARSIPPVSITVFGGFDLAYIDHQRFVDRSTLFIFSATSTYYRLALLRSWQALSLIEEGSDGFTERHRAIAQHAISVGHPWVSAIYDECKETGDVRGLLVGDRQGRAEFDLRVHRCWWAKRFR